MKILSKPWRRFPAPGPRLHHDSASASAQNCTGDRRAASPVLRTNGIDNPLLTRRYDQQRAPSLYSIKLQIIVRDQSQSETMNCEATSRLATSNRQTLCHPLSRVPDQTIEMNKFFLQVGSLVVSAASGVVSRRGTGI